MRSKTLTIFEGPDGSGKSTAAQQYARLTNAKYVHFPALPKVTKGLARMYVEAMLPALLGYQNVVLDRCWLSEGPYGEAFREGQDRLGSGSRRMLERLAMRCGAVVVWCDPGYERVCNTYLSRRDEELLEHTGQLEIVYDLYQDRDTYLPYVTHDYSIRDVKNQGFQEEIEMLRMPCHDLSYNTAGNLDAKTVIVGESFAERKEHDPWYQWPFASFSHDGCSQWLAGQLDKISCSESELLWLNADMNLELIYDLNPQQVIALGLSAQTSLYALKIEATTVKHPQHHKRFHSGEPYPLLDYL